MLFSMCHVLDAPLLMEEVVKISENYLDAPSAVLWLVDGRSITDDDRIFFEQQLNADEAARYARFVRPQRRRQFLLGRMLLRLALSRMMNLSINTIGVIERPGKSPGLLIAGSLHTQPGFSLSHSRDWIACAVSTESAIGLDIEAIDSDRDFNGIAQTAFHANEAAWLQRQAGNMRVAAFYHLWSLKEAWYKLMSNRGEDRPLPDLTDPDGELKSQGDGWFSFTLPHAALSVVICTDHPMPSVQVAEPVELTRDLWRLAQARPAPANLQRIEARAVAGAGVCTGGISTPGQEQRLP